MALSTAANKVIHSGNGVATSFAYTFPILEASHLQVIYTDAGGNAITLAPSLYSATGIGGLSGGAVTYPLSGSPLANGETLTILRTVPLTQLTVFSNQGGYYPEIVEGRFDRVYMGLQQLSEEIGRATLDPPSVQRADVCETLAALKGLTSRPSAVLVKQGQGRGPWAWFAGDTTPADDALVVECTSGAPGRYKRFTELSYFHPKDYGVQFGVPASVAANTTAMQACINAAQKVKGTIVLPSEEHLILVNGLTIGVLGTDQTCHFLSSSFDPSAASYAGNPYQYVGMGGFKLADAANTHLFEIVKSAAPPRFTGVTLLGNGSAQSGTSWVIHCSDAIGDEAYYRFTARLDHCHVIGGKTGGVYLGAFRGGFMAEYTWFQYCGTLTTDAAIRNYGYDLQMEFCGIGANPGIGLDIINAAQVQCSNNVFWMNHQHVVIGAGAGDIGFVGDVFDMASDHGVVVNGATASYAHGARTFIGCKWRRGSAAADNVKSDIYVNADVRLILVAPDFQGKYGEANGPKYNIETNGTCNVQLLGYNYLGYSGAVGYGTAFTNDWSDITPCSEILQTYVDANYVFIGGKNTNHSLRVLKNNGSTIDSWTEIEGTNFAVTFVRAGSAASNSKIAVFGKGTGGTQIEVNGGYVSFFGATPVVKQTVTGSKGANAALTSLIAALVAYGIITDTTS